MFNVFLVLVALAYGILNIPLVNQMASPFIAVFLLYFISVAYDQKKSFKKIESIEEKLGPLIEENKKLKNQLNNTEENEDSD